MAESLPPPYSPPPATETNPNHAGYDRPGEGQDKYGPYLQQQQQQHQQQQQQQQQQGHGQFTPLSFVSESAPPPYCQAPSPATGANPFHAGYDQSGEGQDKYGPYLQQQQQQQQQGHGQLTPGQGTYPLIQQPATTTTQVNVIQAPVIVGVANRDYTCSAIWVCLCCFFPTGIVAMYYANKAQDEYARGDVAAANSSNSMARMFIIISIGIGIIGAVVAAIVPQVL